MDCNALNPTLLSWFGDARWAGLYVKMYIFFVVMDFCANFAGEIKKDQRL